jgi:DNA-directed RNA polymerase specialized sigma subunit
MPKAKTDRRRRVAPIVAAVVQPVAKRLSRREALLIEMRYEQDVQLKRIGALQLQVDAAQFESSRADPSSDGARRRRASI